jgi:glycosyltransferase involved in cell wall biosynthesis
MIGSMPLVSFCMSTYKRPELLHKQLSNLLLQEYRHFEIIVSDNDPEGSAKSVVENINDSRILYFSNEVNLGMINSFNKSIERSNGEFIVMITDDDPINTDFLSVMHSLYIKFPFYSIYAGFERVNKPESGIEFFTKDNFLEEILDPSKTKNLLWSSALIRKEDAIVAGMLPNYGSPHLSDHAFIALTGSINGAIVLNKMFSSLSSHDSNFSKLNFQHYVAGCKGFYSTILNSFAFNANNKNQANIVEKHLSTWFIGTMFNLKRYYTISKNDRERLDEINNCCKEILRFGFMKKVRIRYYAKNFIFQIKRYLRVLK